VRVLLALRVVSQMLDFVRDSGIVCGNRTSITERPQIFCRVKRKCCDGPERTDLPSLVFGAVRLASVLDHGNVVTRCQLQDRIHVAQLPKQVDRNYRFGSFCDHLRNRLRIQAKVVLVDIGKYRPGTRSDYRLHRRDKHIRRCDNLVVGPDIERAQSEE
jgi:hypothetical protein